MSKKWPEKSLQERILWEEPIRELIRLVGYAGVKLDEFRPLVQPLVERNGLEPMKAIGDLVLRVDELEPRFVRLHPNARPLAWPLLGPDPKNPPWWAKLATKIPDASVPAPPSEATEPRPKAKRKRTSAPL